MNREERTDAIVLALDRCAERFCSHTGGIHLELASEYKGGDEETENLRYRRAFIFYNSFLAEFKYTTHAPLGVVNSILECMIHPDKSREGLSIPLGLLLDYCDNGTAIPLCIPGILDPKGMEEAFDLIGGVLEKNMPMISEMLGTTDGRNKMEQAYFSEIASIYKTDVDNAVLYVGDALDSFFTLRFCSSTFINELKGDRKTAIKQLKKVKKKLGYEKRTLELWESDETAALEGLSSIRAGLESYNKQGVAGTNKKETGAFFLSWLILTVGFSAIYLGLFFLLYAMESKNAVYLLGPMSNIPYYILAGFLSAIAASYFTRFWFYRKLFPKDYESLCAADQVNNGKGADKLIKWMLRIIVVCSLVGILLFTRWGVKFLDDGFVDNTKFFSLNGPYYEYEELDHVYYLPNRVNGFGETIEFPSYVLVFKDGREIDLYEYDDIEFYEKPLLAILEENGVRVASDGKGT